VEVNIYSIEAKVILQQKKKKRENFKIQTCNILETTKKEKLS